MMQVLTLIFLQCVMELLSMSEGLQCCCMNSVHCTVHGGNPVTCERDQPGARCLYKGNYPFSEVSTSNDDEIVLSCLSSSSAFLGCRSRDTTCCASDWCNCPVWKPPVTPVQHTNTTPVIQTDNPVTPQGNKSETVHCDDGFLGNSTENVRITLNATDGEKSRRGTNCKMTSNNPPTINTSVQTHPPTQVSTTWPVNGTAVSPYSTNNVTPTAKTDSTNRRNKHKMKSCKPCHSYSSNRSNSKSSLYPSRSQRRRNTSKCCETSNVTVAPTILSPTLQPRTLNPDVTPMHNFDDPNDNNDDKQPYSDERTHYILVSVLVGSLCGFVLIVLSIVIILLVIKHRRRLGSFDVGIGVSVPVTVNYAIARNELDLTLTDSGPGLPSLEQLTICRQITLTDHIGTGRYGDVWCGHWLGEKVAVKIFASKDEESWDHEVNIYQTPQFRHSGILGFIAADRRDTGTWTQLWLVTDYCEFGSLHDFLSHNAVDLEMMLKLAETAVAGLSHLHMPILGMKGKPAMAHRDIKSRNYLVRRDCSCVLGDFGLAVTHDSVRDKVNIRSTTRVGTIRYMAPEVLTDKLDSSHFESLKHADIYSFALVLWEITRRCHINSWQHNYEVPYYDMVGPDPSYEEMSQVVAVKKLRPTVLKQKPCEQYEHLETMTKIMRECWSDSPFARLPALRIKKTLTQMRNEFDVAQHTIPNTKKLQERS